MVQCQPGTNGHSKVIVYSFFFEYARSSLSLSVSIFYVGSWSWDLRFDAMHRYGYPGCPPKMLLFGAYDKTLFEFLLYN